MKDGKLDRRAYETAVVATLRDRLRAGDVWVWSKAAGTTGASTPTTTTGTPSIDR